jgi:CRP-like cAMP-binding protein
VDIGLYVKDLEPERYAAGEVLFQRGDVGGTMYVVKEGEVELTYGPGRSVRVGAGQSFGEMSIIDKSTRSADGVAVTDVELFPISQGLFLILVQETPYFALEVMRSLSERLRNANAANPRTD